MSGDKLIINVALTGNVPTKADNPFLPTSADEIAADVVRCYEAGASVFHIHAREENGQPSYRLEVFREIITKIRARCQDDPIICVTTSGRVFNTFDKRSQVLDLEGDLKPAMASLTLGSMNFPKQASVNDPDLIRRLAERMSERRIVPELEIFDLGMVDYSKYLIQKGILSRPFYYNLLLGSLGTLSATPLHLALIVEALPEKATWAATGIGRFQFEVNCLAMAMGGHVRVGLEDNLYLDVVRRDFASNPRLVERLVAVARAMGREPATPSEARQLIGLDDFVVEKAGEF